MFGPDPAAVPSPAPPTDSDGLDLLREAINLVRLYIAQEADEQRKLSAAEVASKLQRILAEDERQQDDLLRGKLSPRAIRNALGG